MAGKGAPKGMRYGGRVKGVPNKTNLARAEQIKEANHKAGVPLGVEVMRDDMLRWTALAAQFQPGGPTPDQEKYDRYIKLRHDAAKDLAPYETPKLQSTTLIGDRDKPITHTLTVKFV